MTGRTVRRMIWILAAGAVLVIAIGVTGKAAPEPPVTEPVFLHRFAEVDSDRAGFRKYAGTTKRCTITGTLLGVYDDTKPIPVGALGAVAIGHTSFYYAADFKLVTKPGLSMFYAPSALKLPDELLQ